MAVPVPGFGPHHARTDPSNSYRCSGHFPHFRRPSVEVSDPTLFGRPVVLTNRLYRFLVAEQLAAIGIEADIVLEPVRRDSGPAIVAGATFGSKRDGNPVIVALAADHVVTDPISFVESCAKAREAAEADRIVTFGVRPSRPATEYGYIRPGEAIGPSLFAIEKFVEKPDAETAARYMAEDYLWNSGNFMFAARCLIDEYKRFEPESAAAILRSVEAAGKDLGFYTLECESFARATAKSIDYSVMERTSRAAVMPVSYEWSDVGSWQAVWELSTRDEKGNAAQGPALFVDFARFVCSY